MRVTAKAEATIQSLLKELMHLAGSNCYLIFSLHLGYCMCVQLSTLMKDQIFIPVYPMNGCLLMPSEQSWNNRTLARMKTISKIALDNQAWLTQLATLFLRAHMVQNTAWNLSMQILLRETKSLLPSMIWESDMWRQISLYKC